MKSLGYAAHTFASAEDFLESGRLDDTACLILDVNMPGISGIALQNHLHAQGNLTPVIFVSAAAEAAIQAQALKAGAVGFLNKPFKQECLINHLDTALKCHRDDDAKR